MWYTGDLSDDNLGKNKVICSKCHWVGNYEDLLKSEGEYKNIKRTKLIDKVLDAS